MALGPGYPIVIQSGISAGAPSTVGNIPMFDGGSPPDILVDSLLREVAGPPVAIIVGATDPEATALETFRTRGGIVSEGTAEDSLVLGAGAFAGPALSAQSIALGFGASLGASGGALNDSVVVGGSSTVTSPALTTGAFQSAIVVFGPRNVVSSAGGQPSEYVTVLGAGNSVTAPAGATNGRNVVVGQFNTLLTALDVIVVGNSAAPPSQAGQSVVIGNSTSIAPAIFNTVMVGHGTAIAGGNFHTIVGATAARSGGFAGGDYAVAIGFNALVTSIDYGVAIGAASRARGSTGNIAIGRAADVSHANAIAIGPGATSERANSCVIGSDNSGGDYRTFVFGNRGDTCPNGIQDVLWRPTDLDGSVSNTPGSGLTVRAGLGSGNAVSANISLDVGVPGGSGVTVQTARTGARVSASATAGDTYLMIWDVDNGTLERVTVGAPNSGGAGFKLLCIPN